MSKPAEPEKSVKEPSWDLSALFNQENPVQAKEKLEAYIHAASPCLDLYRKNESRQRVVDFFIQLTGSETISLPILYYAERNDIPLSLAFSLAWIESRYRITAVNRNARSIDRGLFQLNSRSFPHLREVDFFDPEINVREAMKHLRYCMDEGGNEVVALAIYNAGRSRVTYGGTPRMTLEYIAALMEYRKELERDFWNFLLEIGEDNSRIVMTN